MAFCNVFRKTNASGVLGAQLVGVLDVVGNGVIKVNGSSISATELGFIDGVTAGTGAASKAVVTDAYKTFRLGGWAAAGAAGTAVVFAATQNFYSDGQLDLFSIFGTSTANLTSAYSAKCGRFRHLATGSSLTVAHETYGLIGQMCAKGVTLTHIHGGLIGTFEGTGAAVVLNSPYTTGGHGCVIARPGGHANITATTPLLGFLAFNNGAAAIASGTLAAFGTSVASATYQWPVGLYIPSGTCTLPIDVTSSVMGATGRIAKFYGSMAAPAVDDGYGAVEIDLTLTGTAGGTNHAASALSAWVNIPSGTVGAGKYVCAQNNGVYEDSAAVITGAKVVYGMRAQKLLGDTDAKSFAFSLNMNSVAHTAIFEAPTTTDMGAVAGAASAGAFKIPFLCDFGGTIYYLNLYTS